MSVLHPSDRNMLENAILRARGIAEDAADKALQNLAVNEANPRSTMTSEQRELRVRLRAVSRRVGGYEQLRQCCAYEQWHRMLFARFLAENNLLIHPEYCVPVTLEDCADLARTDGDGDQWVTAAKFASEMLPGIFPQDDPVLEVRLAAEDRVLLERELEGLPKHVFTSDDGLGWTYQFWQSKMKAAVNRSGRKISGPDICAVTQLFTEHYMVQFLLQNTLGAWWFSLHPDSPLREKWVYYKEKVQRDFSTWPKTVAEVRVIDPCCGSGHFLVEALNMLLDMYREESGVSGGDAAVSAIANNLFGLEIDQRCTQIAAFAVALTAWKAGASIDGLPVPNIACCGLPLGATKDEWKAIANGDTRLAQVLAGMHDLFASAHDLGSLIDPSDLEILKWHNISLDELREHLEVAFAKEKVASDPASAVFGEAARGAIRAFEFLVGKYHLAVTNPPFRNLSSLNDQLQSWCKQHFSKAKKDLANCFIERCSRFPFNGADFAMVTPHSWLFLTADEALRKHLLENQSIGIVARLGPHAFEEITGEVVQVALVVFGTRRPKETHQILGIPEPHSLKTPASKAQALLQSQGRSVSQIEQLKNSQAKIILDVVADGALMSKRAGSYQGLKTGDDGRLRRLFWEIARFGNRWRRLQGTVESTRHYGGLESVVDWCRDGKDMARLQGLSAWGKPGVAVSQMSGLPVALYSGEVFDSNVSAIVPKDPDDLECMWVFCKSVEYIKAVRAIDQSMKVTNSSFIQVPFDFEHWKKVAEEEYPNGLPSPHSDDPTQWLFRGSIIGSESPLQVAVARLLGYHWPEQPEGDTLTEFADADGIACIPGVRGERPAVDRVRELLSVSYGNEWSVAKEDSTLEQVGYRGKGLDVWLRDAFFDQHCKLFHNRPFIWHIWDGRKDGFAALVNYHGLDRAKLEKLIYYYLGEWIERQKDDARDGKPGAEARLIAAEDLKKRLELILVGEEPYDIYVRWKSLEEQPVGWEPDLNDGVRLNIRPFVKAEVLRSKVTINWNKDRGLNPSGAGFLLDAYGNKIDLTERLNDVHLKLEQKIAARQAKETK